MSETFQQIAKRVGELVEEKNHAYGSSFSTSGAALQLLYPNGIPVDQMADALLIARIWDKLMRIATHRDALGENPYQDILGYGILGVALHQQKEQAPCPGSVRRPDAIDPSKAQPDSAASEKRTPTTTSDDASSSSTKSHLPSGFSGSTLVSDSTSTSSAPARSATEPASEREVVLSRLQNRNKHNRCAWCAYRLKAASLCSSDEHGGERLYFCSIRCRGDFDFAFWAVCGVTRAMDGVA